MPLYHPGYYHRPSEESDDKKQEPSVEAVREYCEAQMSNAEATRLRNDWPQVAETFKALHPEWIDSQQNVAVLKDYWENELGVEAPTLEQVEQSFYERHSLLRLNQGLIDKKETERRVKEFQDAHAREEKDFADAYAGEMSLEELKRRAAREEMNLRKATGRY